MDFHIRSITQFRLCDSQYPSRLSNAQQVYLNIRGRKHRRLDTLLAHGRAQVCNGQLSPHEDAHTPAQFMFIDRDSSNGGMNAKSVKLVRSFVMKSASHKKP